MQQAENGRILTTNIIGSANLGNASERHALSPFRLLYKPPYLMLDTHVQRKSRSATRLAYASRETPPSKLVVYCKA